MSIAVYETKKSRNYSGGGNRWPWEYIAFRSFNIDEIATAVLAASPAQYGAWSRMWDEKKFDHQGGGVWIATIPYGVGDYPVTGVPGAPAPGGGVGGTGGSPAPPPPAPNADDPLGRQWEFDFTGGTTHITQSDLRVYQAGRNGLVAPDTQHAIGVGKDKVDGVDIFTANQRMTYTTRIPVMTQAYAKLLEDLSCCVNSTTFLGRPAGEVLFLGAKLNWAVIEGFTGVFQFDTSRNRTNVTITPDMVVPEKKGWDHLWVSYEDKASNGFVVAQPKAVYVDRVYDYKDLNQLGLFS